MSSSTCPRCGTGKASSHFACGPCWYSLPLRARREILNAYRAHGPFSDEWVDAAKAAFAAWGMDVPEWIDSMAG